MRDQDSLGFTRRSRCVDDVGEVVEVNIDSGILRALVVELAPVAIERQRRYFDGPVYSTLYRAAARLLIAAVHAWDGA